MSPLSIGLEEEAFMKGKIGGEIMLLIVALIWGTSFVAQKTGMDTIGPFTFGSLRMYIGFLALLPVIFVLSAIEKKKKALEPATKISAEQKKKEQKDLLVGGLVCGMAIYFAAIVQQVGLQYTTSGKAGFITALYIVIVPVFGLFLKRKVKPILWACIAVALVGLYLLSVTEGLNINKGDLIMVICAFGFAAHILACDHFTAKADGVKLSALQFLVAGIIGTPLMIYESFTLEGLLGAAMPLLYVGVMSCGVAYTLQMVAQKRVEPTMTSLILSLESVIAIIAGIILLSESINSREIIGCALMFAAIIVAQLPSKEERLNNQAAKETKGSLEEK